MEMISRVRLRN